MNSSAPEPRLSLILRLPHGGDPQAWEEFVTLYEPFLHRFARRRGLDEAAASDVVQLVLMNVHRAVQRWQPEEGGRRFRSWLFAIARNEVLDMQGLIRRHSHPNGSDAWRSLQNVADRGVETAREEGAAYRREIIFYAASKIRHQLDEKTWLAFWRTAVEGESCAAAAEALDMKVGSVYAARSRVIARIREQVQLMTGCDSDL